MSIPLNTPSQFTHMQHDTRDSWADIGITFGAFDLMHPGHTLLFKEAKDHCSYLIVGLHVDPSVERDSKNKPIQSVFERYLLLASCRYVDEIIPYETEDDVIVMLNTLGVSKRFIGADYIDKPFTGKELCELKGIQVHYCKRDHEFSSSSLRRKIETNGNNAKRV